MSNINYTHKTCYPFYAFSGITRRKNLRRSDARTVMVKNRALSLTPQVDAEEKRSSRERGNRDFARSTPQIPVFFPLKDTFRSDVRERTRVEERKEGERTGLSRKSESKSSARSCVRNARRLADYKTRKRGYAVCILGQGDPLKWKSSTHQMSR